MSSNAKYFSSCFEIVACGGEGYNVAKGRFEMEQRSRELEEAKRIAALGGGEQRIAKQHEKGRLFARERIELLVDPGSFVEWNMLVQHHPGAPGDGIVTGYGTIEGRTICLFSQDTTVLAGSIGPLHGYKMYRTVERALDMGVPLIGLFDSPGARAGRMDQPNAWDAAQARDEKCGNSIFFPNTQASGVIPQISAVLGSCAGISVYSPALTDFVFMVDGISHMFITGPRIVRSVMGEDISMEELGGAKVHARLSGVCDFRVKSEVDCFQKIRQLLSFLPANNRQAPPLITNDDEPDRREDELATIVPTDPHKPYDMHEVIVRLVDNGDFLEVKEEFAPEIIVGFARLAGYAVGIVANQPMVRAGSLTIDSSDKQARFMRFCDCFNIPLILLVDTPAYAPGSGQEHGGIIRHGAKVLYALCEAMVPRIAVVIRKAYGGGNLGMGVLPGLGTDFVFAWPIAEIGTLGAEQAVDLFHAEDIKRAPEPEQFRAQKIREYRERYANPLAVASKSTHIDDVIEPGDTRWQLIKTLELLRNKKVARYPKRHGNIPV